MAKIGYIMAISQYDKLEEDRQWMNDYGCIRIVEEQVWGDCKPVWHTVSAHTHIVQTRRSAVENKRCDAEIRVIGND